MKKILLLLAILVFCASSLFSAPITVGLIQHLDGSLDNGYILFSPNNGKTTYLMDKCGYVINKWTSQYQPGFSSYLLPDGSLLRTGYLHNKKFVAGGSGGIIERLDWEGKIIWSYQLSNDNECMHHDIKPMPNGNILAVCWDRKTAFEAINLGRKPTNIDSNVWSEKIIELRPIGTDSAEIVWEWKAWDHLVQYNDKMKPNYAEISTRPELIDINYVVNTSLRDWLHFNSVDYNEELDQILLSSFNFGEVWIIDHSTSKTEAASHKGGKYSKGGDLLYRWGNPESYAKGTINDRKFYFQHDARWIPKGYPNEQCISVFNNQRINNGVRFSSADFFKPNVDINGFYGAQLPYLPTDVKWSYTAEEPQYLYSPNLSSVQQLSNGNILICNGFNGHFSEIDSTKKEVWYYVNPVSISGITKQGESPQMTNQVFRCNFYPDSSSAFLGKDLTRKGLVENKNWMSDYCSFDTTSVEDYQFTTSAYPNPARDYITVDSEIFPSKLTILNLQGQELITQSFTNTISTKELPNGLYLLRITNANGFSGYNKFAITR